MSARLYLTEGGGSIKDGSVVWQIQDIRETTPVGTIRVALCVINGYLMCDGREVSREKYNKLVAFADKNNLWTEDKENYVCAAESDEPYGTAHAGRNGKEDRRRTAKYYRISRMGSSAMERRSFLQHRDRESLRAVRRTRRSIPRHIFRRIPLQ